jgi:hypothetical protein
MSYVIVGVVCFWLGVAVMAWTAKKERESGKYCEYYE